MQYGVCNEGGWGPGRMVVGANKAARQAKRVTRIELKWDSAGQVSGGVMSNDVEISDA